MHPTLRTTFKHATLAATILLGALWLTSTTLWFDRSDSKGNRLALARGQLILIHLRSPSTSPFVTTYTFGSPSLDLHFTWTNKKLFWHLDLPLWAPAALAVLLHIAARRARTPTNPSSCPICAYDRAGLSAHSPCPECGNHHPLHSPSCPPSAPS